MVGVVSERIEVQIVAVSHSDELLSSQSTIQHCQSSHSPASPLYEIVGPVGLEARFFWILIKTAKYRVEKTLVGSDRCALFGTLPRSLEPLLCHN